MLLICTSSAFAMWYVDRSGNILNGPDPDYFETLQDWRDWCEELGVKPYIVPKEPDGH